jgi:hypothetical protein
MSEWGHPTRPLKCAACGEKIGRASVWPDGTLHVGDRADIAVPLTKGADSLAQAQEVARHLAQASQKVALDHELRDSDPTRWAAEFASAEDATRAAMAEIKRLRSGTQDETYQFVCRGGHPPHTPRVSAARLAAAVRDAPNEPLMLA